MNLFQRRYYAPDGAGANAPGIAAPDAGNADIGAKDADTAAQQTKTEPMKREDRAGYAAARRQAQAEAEALRQRVDAMAKSRGFESFEDMEVFNSNQLLEDGKLNADSLTPLLNRVVNEHPAIKQAMAMTAAGVVDTSLRDFQNKFPELNVLKVEDFFNLPHYDQFSEYVGMGLDFVKAYKLSHEDDILARRTAATKQAAINSMNGKSHMTSTQGNAEDGEDIAVPEETMRNYRTYLPNWTEKQIRTHYAKTQKG